MIFRRSVKCEKFGKRPSVFKEQMFLMWSFSLGIFDYFRELFARKLFISVLIGAFIIRNFCRFWSSFTEVGGWWERPAIHRTLQFTWSVSTLNHSLIIHKNIDRFINKKISKGGLSSLFSSGFIIYKWTLWLCIQGNVRAKE